LKDLGWEINYNNAKTSAGKCKRKATRNRYTGEITVKSKTVELSNHLLRQNLEEGKASEWEETIRHELAHAVDIELRGKSNHDRTWKAVANAMLSTGRVTFSSDDLKDVKLSRYTLKCVEDDCNFTSPSHKKRKENAKTYPCCQTCYDNGKGYKRLLQVQNY
jgi:predicted SprT family Zn-dependent metalloprotease